MKYIYASRSGNVESIVTSLNHGDLLKIDSGNEVVNEPYVLFTYTDGYGDIPYEVENFLQVNASFIQAVVASGDMGYGEAFCQSGDKIAQMYNVECLMKIENDGTSEDIEKLKEILAKF